MSIADTMAGMARGGKKPGIGEETEHQMGRKSEADGGEHSKLFDHGDGTFHSVTSDGERTEHPRIGHAVVHLAAHHEPEGKHFHVHQDGGGGHTSHQAAEGGKAEGPHDHENIEALDQHMHQFLQEEEHEGEGGYGAHGGGEGSIFE